MMIKASDTDVLVIAVSVLPSLQQSGLQQLRVSFGQRNNLWWIPVHELCLAIGLAKTRQILFFHAFTGCDVEAEGVDYARLDMFARKQRPYEAIPPTLGALLQHTKRAAYQAGCISGVNQQYIKIIQKHRILQSGVGEKKMVCGTFSGQTFHLLPRVVSN